MPEWVIHLYGRDLEADPPAERDLGVASIRLPAPDRESIATLAVRALQAREGRGAATPEAGHVTDSSGKIVLRLRRTALNAIEVEEIEDTEP